MSRYLDMQHLAVVVKTRRGELSLRDLARGLDDISPSTLSRVESGKMVDVQTFLCICDWLQVSPSEFIKSTDEPSMYATTPLERIEAILRADRTLSTEVTEAFIILLKIAYKSEHEDRLQ